MMPARCDDPRPNIIWIMSDDLSWGDLGCYGQRRIETPHIDALAAGGTRFTGCCCGAPICAPSRSTLMQGLHSGHATVRANMIEGYRHSLQPGDITVAEALHAAGYATGLFGKWGLAVQDQPGLPRHKGFEEFCGYLNQRKAHSYYPPYLWHNRRRVPLPQNVGHDHRSPNDYDEAGRIIPNGVDDPGAAKYSFDLYARKARRFLRDHRDEPFFLYLAYTIPHGVYEVPELGRYRDRDWPLTHRVLAAMISRLDDEVGRLMELLRELGIDERTLVFFVSDNGYSVDGAAENPSFDEVFDHRGPWKGGKGTLHQGGLRVPAIARWPGHVPAGVTSEHVWGFRDLMPTAAELAGAEAPQNDGVSLVPTLLGRHDEQQEHEHLYWEFGHAQAVRIDRWWVYRHHPDSPVEVYDAIDDPGETQDLASEKPELAKRGREIFAEEHVPTPYFPSPGETPEDWAERRRRAGAELDNNVDR
jgi:arylsulfatase A-like enzyme